MLTRAFLGAVLVGLVSLPRESAAIPVTWAFEGTVRETAVRPDIDDPESILASLSAVGIVVGAPFRGSVSFDSDSEIVFNDFDPYTGYALGLLGLEIEFPGLSLTEPAGLSAIVTQQRTDPLEIGDPLASGMIFVNEFYDPTLGLPSASYVDRPHLELGLVSDQQDFFALSPLLTDPPDLSALPPWSVDLATAGSARGAGLYLTSAQERLFEVTGEITSLVRVPEPAALALLAIGLLAVGYPRAR